MASYFVDRRAQANGDHEVHDRSRCPPACFPPEGDAEYLGEFLHAAQALMVAELRYPQVNGCPWCVPEVHIGEPEPMEPWPAAHDAGADHGLVVHHGLA